MTNFLFYTLLASTVASTAAAKPDPAAYPELEIEAFLPALVTGLKRNLPDAYSARDLTVCAPHKVEMKNGRPVGWTTQFAVNTRNAVGGYTGLSSYVAFFKNGRVKRIFASGLAGKEGLDELINRSIMKRIARCRPVPQVQLQTLLDTTPAL